MSISPKTFTILLVSIFVSLVIMIAAYIITRSKIKKIKNNALSSSELLGDYDKTVSRKNAGELLWDLRDKSKNPLEDSQLEFLINTAIRNKYKSVNVLLSDSNYEIISLEKIAKLEKKELKPDMTIIFNGNFQETFKKSYKILKQKQMISIVNASKRNKEIKGFILYLKSINAKYDFIHIGKGIILVVK